MEINYSIVIQQKKLRCWQNAKSGWNTERSTKCWDTTGKIYLKTVGCEGEEKLFKFQDSQAQILFKLKD